MQVMIQAEIEDIGFFSFWSFLSNKQWHYKVLAMEVGGYKMKGFLKSLINNLNYSMSFRPTTEGMKNFLF